MTQSHESVAQLHPQFEVVQFDGDKNGSAQLALEYSRLGAVLDFEMQTAARPSQREVIIQTASDNIFYLIGNRLVDMNKTREKGEIVEYKVGDLESVEVGKRWGVDLTEPGPDGEPGFDTSKVKKILVGYNLSSAGSANYPQRGMNPFRVVERELELYKRLKTTREMGAFGLKQAY